MSEPMSNTGPETTYVPQVEPGRSAAFLVYGLYLLSIPSFALFAPIGVIVAYMSRNGAGPQALAHLNYAIHLFWVAFMWGVGIFIASVVAWVLTIILVGFLFLWILGAIAFVVMLWFTIMSALALMKLLDRRAP